MHKCGQSLWRWGRGESVAGMLRGMRIHCLVFRVCSRRWRRSVANPRQPCAPIFRRRCAERRSTWRSAGAVGDGKTNDSDASAARSNKRDRFVRRRHGSLPAGLPHRTDRVQDHLTSIWRAARRCVSARTPPTIRSTLVRMGGDGVLHFSPLISGRNLTDIPSPARARSTGGPTWTPCARSRAPRWRACATWRTERPVDQRRFGNRAGRCGRRSSSSGNARTPDPGRHASELAVLDRSSRLLPRRRLRD